MSEFKNVIINDRVSYHPPFLTDDPLVVDKGYCHFNRRGQKDFIECVTAYKISGGCVEIMADTWRKEKALIKLSFVSPTAYRLQMFPFCKVPEKMFPVYDFAPVEKIGVDEDETFLYFSTDRLTLKLRKNPWELITVLDSRELTREQIQDMNVDQRYKGIPLGFTFENGVATDCFETMYLHSDESFYGFGEKFTAFDKRGQKITTWQRDAQSCDSDISYKGQPYFVSSYGFSMLLNTFTRNHFNMGATSGISYNMETEDPYLDYYMFANRDFKALVEDYTDLSGKPPMLPRYAFGYWQSKMVYQTRREVEEIVNKFRSLHIPLDTVHIDGFAWMDEKANEPYVWSETRFPDHKEMLKNLRDMGIKVSVWVNPYCSGSSDGETWGVAGCYDNMRAKDYLVKNKDGEPYLFSPGEGNPNTHGSAAYDLTNPEVCQYLKGRIKQLIYDGVAIVKTDFGEEIPADAVFYDGTTGVQSHNKYTHLYAKLFHEACQEARDELGAEPAMLWGRCGYTGNHIHPANWAGDSSGALNTGYALLNAGLSMAMSGVSFWGYDLGGFYYSDYEGKRAKPSDYEYVRSIQMGLMSPLCRAHAQATDREPWAFSDEAMAEFIRMDKLHYAMLPYIYTLAYNASFTGVPLIRPMVMEFQNDYTVKSLSGQYMLGDSMLVAPVFDQAVQHVYLPEGTWCDFFTGERIKGARWITPENRFDYIPVFVRQGHGVVMTDKEMEYIADENWTQLKLVLNITDTAQGKYYDDGVKGCYSAVLDGSELNVETTGFEIEKILVSSDKKITAITVNGEKWPVSQHGGFVKGNK